MIQGIAEILVNADINPDKERKHLKKYGDTTLKWKKTKERLNLILQTWKNSSLIEGHEYIYIYLFDGFVHRWRRTFPSTSVKPSDALCSIQCKYLCTLYTVQFCGPDCDLFWLKDPDYDFSNIRIRIQSVIFQIDPESQSTIQE